MCLSLGEIAGECDEFVDNETECDPRDDEHGPSVGDGPQWLECEVRGEGGDAVDEEEGRDEEERLRFCSPEDEHVCTAEDDDGGADAAEDFDVDGVSDGE